MQSNHTYQTVDQILAEETPVTAARSPKKAHSKKAASKNSKHFKLGRCFVKTFEVAQQRLADAIEGGESVKSIKDKQGFVLGMIAVMQANPSHRVTSQITDSELSQKEQAALDAASSQKFGVKRKEMISRHNKRILKEMRKAVSDIDPRTAGKPTAEIVEISTAA